MGVGRSEELDAVPAQFEGACSVVEVEPAEVVLEEGVERRRVEVGSTRLRARRTPEVRERVLEHRPVEVVRAVHEHPRHPAERFECATDALEPLGMPQVVAGVDDQVGLVAGQRAHEVLLRALPRRHVQVAQVQDRQRAGARLEDRQHLVAHREARALDEDTPGERAEPRDGRRP